MFVTYLQFFQLLEDHIIRHVVKQPIGGGEDDVTQLHVKGGAVSGFWAVNTQIQIRSTVSLVLDEKLSFIKSTTNYF